MIGSTNEEQCRKILEKWHFQTARKLGKGSYGHVLLASKFVSGSSTYYAVKCISLKKSVKDPKLKTYLVQQTDTMSSLDHPNIVRLEHTFTQCGWYFFVMEYCDMGNLLQYQAKLPNKVFPLSEASRILAQIVRGVQVIHSNNILHRDIKCENIFLKKKKSGGMICKIGDFGFAKVIDQTTKTNCGTTIYMAPQVLALVPYDFKADIWSLGVVFYQMIYGEYPFKSLNIEKQIRDKCTPVYSISQHLNLEAKMSKKYISFAQDFFKRIFALNPQNRITLAEIMEHPLISNPEDVASDSTTDDIMEGEAEWEKNRIKYIQKVLAEVKAQKFLSSSLEDALTFYLNKVVKMFLQENSVLNLIKDHPNLKLSTELTSLKKTNEDHLYQSMKRLESCAGELKSIPNFFDGFNLSFEEFSSFKQGYRNTVGLVFEEVQKKISNQDKRARLKFKVFTCHLINRIFKTGVKKEIFPKYQIWLKNKGKKTSPMINFEQFQEWIKCEDSEKLLLAIEDINNIFYKKG